MSAVRTPRRARPGRVRPDRAASRPAARRPGRRSASGRRRPGSPARSSAGSRAGRTGWSTGGSSGARPAPRGSGRLRRVGHEPGQRSTPAASPAVRQADDGRPAIGAARAGQPAWRVPSPSIDRVGSSDRLGSSDGLAPKAAWAAASRARSTAAARWPGPSQCSSTQPVDSRPGRERGIAGDGSVERQRRLDAADLGLVERPPQAGDRGRTVGRVDHELGDQRVVVGRHPLARLDRGIDPDARARPA